MPFDRSAAKKELLGELMKLAGEHRANGLKAKLAPKPEAKDDFPMKEGEYPPEVAEVTKDDLAPHADVDDTGKSPAEMVEPDGDMLKKLLELMGD